MSANSSNRFQSRSSSETSSPSEDSVSSSPSEGGALADRSLVLRIEALAHGGDGIARHEGEAIFVPFTAPGDEVLAQRLPTRGGAGRARLLSVLKPGKGRQQAPCPVAQKCGGCPLQHLNMEAQRAAKLQGLREVLRRIGGFSAPPLLPWVDSPRPFRYRRRLRFALSPEGWGFRQQRSRELVPVESCLLAEEVVEQAARQVAGAVSGMGGFPSVSALEVDALESGDFALHLELEGALPSRVEARIQGLMERLPKLRGVVLSPSKTEQSAVARSSGTADSRVRRGKKARKGRQKSASYFSATSGAAWSEPLLLGDPVLVDSGHHGLRVRPDLFAQANRLGARLLAEAVACTIASDSSVLELYAGAGTLTLAYAQKVRSLWVSELEGPSLDLARAALSEQESSARLVAGKAHEVAAGFAAEGMSFDHVLLDPPRAGAKELIPALLQLSPQKVSYVSCEPATFARDARALADGGYEMVSVQPFDLFPQTAHLELLAVFEKKPR